MASMAAVGSDYTADAPTIEASLSWIRSQLGSRDKGLMDIVTEGFEREKLDASFYEKAFACRNDFVRKYFAADLRMRNAKVEYLNKALGRPAGTDVINMKGAEEADDAREIAAVFQTKDLVEREKAMDNFLMTAIDNINLFKLFKIDNVLGIAAKLCIIRRWMALDEQTGREMLRALVKGVRGSYGNIEFDTLK